MFHKPLNPHISIIIPVYNVEKYITRALESCINQTFSDIEILVVDDCGNDNSINIAKDYALKDSRIQIIHNIKNLGTFNTRLEGIKKAKGLYLLFLDSDDYITLNACEVLANTTMKNPDIEVVRFNVKCIGFYRNIGKIKQGKIKNPKTLLFPNRNSFSPYVWNKIYKKSLIAHINTIFNKADIKPYLTLGEDILKSTLIVLEAKEIISINESLYFYCKNEKSITNNKTKNFNSYEIILKCLNKLAPLYSLERKFFIKINNVVNYLIYFDKSRTQNYRLNLIKSLRYFFRYQTLIRIFLSFFGIKKY